MHEVSYRNVTLESGFLHEKQELNKNVTIDAVYNVFHETGRIDAFKCDWKEGMDKKPHFFWDSDVVKWMEGAAYILQKEDNPSLMAKVESLIDDIEKNQDDDGYFNIYFTVCEPGKRFTNRHMHELYCAGHLFEAAVAYYEATGRDRFLKLAEKYADCIYKVFVEEKSALFSTPGHEEIELALIRMYRTTGKRKYLDLAVHFLDNRGMHKEKGWEADEEDETRRQSHLPIREQHAAVGHCVRACYLYAAMADAAYETKDEELYKVCKDLFDDIVGKKMFITGGIGSSRSNEGFSIAYDLRDDRAYTETCAAIALAFFAQRMLQFENDARYADIVERIFYNGMIAGLSLDGDKFFYENPLEINLRKHINGSNIFFGECYAITQRVKVFGCSCCPPNLNRVLSALGNYLYGYDNDTIYVNQFAGSSATIGQMKITQKTDFPKNDTVKITVENAGRICIRIPSWCKKIDISEDYTVLNGYAVIENPTKEITVKFDMSPRLIQCDTEVYENNAKAAVICGPYVCAAESIDNIENLHSIFIDKSFSAKAEYCDALSGFKVQVKAYVRKPCEKLYCEYGENFEDITLNMIPYAAFANRGESNMCVWFNVR